MQIDLAQPGDVPRLAELLATLFEQEAEFTPDRATHERGLRLIIDDPQIGRILVLRDDATIQGMANLLYTVSTALGARVAILEDMIVDPSCRGRGLGSKLLDAAIEQARAAGCQRITLLTDRANARAQRFYQSRGFAHSQMTPMRLSLSPKPLG